MCDRKRGGETQTEPERKRVKQRERHGCLHWMIRCSMGPARVPQHSVRYLRMYFVDSVFPAPDSPLTTTD